MVHTWLLSEDSKNQGLKGTHNWAFYGRNIGGVNSCPLVLSRAFMGSVFRDNFLAFIACLVFLVELHHLVIFVITFLL